MYCGSAVEFVELEVTNLKFLLSSLESGKEVGWIKKC